MNPLIQMPIVRSEIYQRDTHGLQHQLFKSRRLVFDPLESIVRRVIRAHDEYLPPYQPVLGYAIGYIKAECVFRLRKPRRRIWNNNRDHITFRYVSSVSRAEKK